MTRPIERIKPILKIIEEAWMRSPDMRLGQLLGNAGVCGYHTEDLTDFVHGMGAMYGTTPILWGTYGKKGDEPLQYKELNDITTPHIEAILSTQEITPYVELILRKELTKRTINETESNI